MACPWTKSPKSRGIDLYGDTSLMYTRARAQAAIGRAHLVLSWQRVSTFYDSYCIMHTHPQMFMAEKLKGRRRRGIRVDD